MGEWFDYKIKFANENNNKKLSDCLVEKGLATRTQRLNRLGEEVIDFDLIVDAFKYRNEDGTPIFEYEKENNIKTIRLSEEDGIIRFLRKWQPDDRIAMAIGREFDDIIEVKRAYTGGFDFWIYYVNKDGDVTRDGVPITNIIGNVNEKLVKEEETCYKISLPIGEENAKWGTFTVPKGNVTYGTYNNEETGQVDKFGIAVMFTEEKLKVSFKTGEVEMLTNDVCSKYYDSKKKYKEEANKEIFLEIPSDNIYNKGDYYIVYLPVFDKISESGNISITIPYYHLKEVDNDTIVINLGTQFKERNTYLTKNGEQVKEYIKNKDIALHYNKFVEFDRNIRGFSEDIKKQTHANYEFFYGIKKYYENGQTINFAEELSGEIAELVKMDEQTHEEEDDMER